MALTLLQNAPQTKEAEREQPHTGFCPFCSCPLNPGEKVCLDCLLDLSIGGTG